MEYNRYLLSMNYKYKDGRVITKSLPLPSIRECILELTKERGHVVAYRLTDKATGKLINFPDYPLVDFSDEDEIYPY